MWWMMSNWQPIDPLASLSKNDKYETSDLVDCNVFTCLVVASISLLERVARP